MKPINVEKKIKDTISVESAQLKSLIESVDFEVVEKIVELISNTSGKVILTGCGTSGTAAKKIVHTLSCISVSAVYLNPADAVHGSLGIINKEDIVVLISKGGNTIELVNLIESMKKSEATLIGVGENEKSIIGEHSDIYLKIITEREPDSFNMLATASTLSVISIFDAIAVVVMEITGFTKEQFGINHPGGAVGQRLLK